MVHSALKIHAIRAAVVLLCAVWASGALAARPWSLVLPDTVVISGGKALLRDVTTAPVPAQAGNMVVHAGGVPNTTVTISRRFILRKLVTAGLSSGVMMQGAQDCRLIFEGRELTTDHVITEIRLALQNVVPAAIPGAPHSWLEIQTPSLRISAQGDWRVEVLQTTPLSPGRNLVRVVLIAEEQRKPFTVTVDLHSFDEVPLSKGEVQKDTPLDAAHFSWEWRDLSDLPSGVVSGRGSLLGTSSTNTLTAGHLLRDSDMSSTPLILAGDMVELMVVRGKVAVTVRGLARQNGCLGQTIPIRNELTGRLVNAKVAGPGLVQWRR